VLDAYKLKSLNTDYLSLFTKLTDGSGLDINAIPVSTEESMAIDLDMDGSSLGGTYELDWNPKNIPEDIRLVLVDNKTGNEIDLNNASSYSFELESKAKSASKEGLKSPQHRVISPEVIKAKSIESRFTILLNASGTTTGTEVGNDIPATVELQQNYPNPFNPTTTIKYGVPAGGVVSLEVFNMLGQKVATLINGENQQAGRHSVQFDASSLSSGIYIYRLKAANTVVTKKLTLIK
ncbi:MAG: T9SS type A sorting domain-containing protein, partial [Gracilimonas sp.]|nr:T9SS type A sorting domain-containing protein [Gracilimonas sp.]